MADHSDDAEPGPQPLNATRHPKHSRLLMATSDGEHYEVEVVEWSPSGEAVKLRHWENNGNSRDEWVCAETYDDVSEVLDERRVVDLLALEAMPLGHALQLVKKMIAEFGVDAVIDYDARTLTRAATRGDAT